MATPTAQLYTIFRECSGLSTDSRSVQPGNLFFALNGANFKGSQFAQAALDSGAKYAVVDDPEMEGKRGIVLVTDTLAALQDLARHHRDQYQIPVLGIGGSNGKTTTKEMLHRVLAKRYRTYATRGNLNNHIGVPLTVLDWPLDLELGVVELGANHIGEIATLCSICKPTHGLITNIGHTHTEGFGGIEGVLRGESELFDYLRKTNGVPFINLADERLRHMVKRFEQPQAFPSPDLSVGDGWEFLNVRWGQRIIHTQLTGDYNFGNVAAAVAVGRFFEVSDDEIVSAIESYAPTNLRSQLIKQNGLTLIVDAYNANPDSMRGALQNLAKFPGHRVAIVGDMNELEDSDHQHLLMGQFIASLGLDEVLLVGEKMKPALQALPTARWFSHVEELLKRDLNFPPNATVLLKASRSVKLEKLLTLLTEQHPDS